MGERINKKNAKEIGRLGGLQAAANRRLGVDKLFEFMKEGGSDKANELLMKLANGEDLTAPQLEFLKQYKDLLEYHKPKLARVEQSGEIDNKIEVIIKNEYAEFKPTVQSDN
jgi:hypothetical protein